MVMICTVYAGEELLSKYPHGLKSKPQLSDLMDEVAVRTPSCWHAIGIRLNLPSEQLRVWDEKPLDQRFSLVFSTWKNNGTPEYSWETMIEVLKSPSVKAIRLAQELNEKFTSTH